MLDRMNLGLARTLDNCLTVFDRALPERPFSRIPESEICSTEQLVSLLPSALETVYQETNRYPAETDDYELVTKDMLDALYEKHKDESGYQAWHTEQNLTSAMTEQDWNRFHETVYELYNLYWLYAISSEILAGQLDMYVQKNLFRVHKTENMISPDVYFAEKNSKPDYNDFMASEYLNFRLMSQILGKTAYAVYMDDKTVNFSI